MAVVKLPTQEFLAARKAVRLARDAAIENFAAKPFPTAADSALLLRATLAAPSTYRGVY